MRDRTNPRHPAFDYRSHAAYFVTICTHDRRRLFGAVRRGRMACNAYGRIVVREWERSEAMRDEIVLDAFVVMPNHLHGIVCIVPPDVDDVSPRGYDLDVGPDPTRSKTTPNDDVGPHGDAALHQRDGHPRWKEGCPQRHAKSLGSMIAGFKGAATTRINRRRGTPGAPVWQSRYHDRILRNEREWRIRRAYIDRNPRQWAEDRARPPKR
jgi:REP element-mobilizing transposase RayT